MSSECMIRHPKTSHSLKLVITRVLSQVSKIAVIAHQSSRIPPKASISNFLPCIPLSQSFC